MEEHKEEDKLKSMLLSKLTESGEKARLIEMLKGKLVESGWRDQVKTLCKEIIEENNKEDITIDFVINKVRGSAQAIVPDEIKKEALQEIRTHLSEHYFF